MNAIARPGGPSASDPIAPIIGRWAASLVHDDLRTEVTDKVQALLVQSLTSAVVGHGGHMRPMVEVLLREEPAGDGGCTVLASGRRVTKGAAAFINSDLIHSGGKLDSYNVLTHPGAVIIPAALAIAEAGEASGPDLIAAVAAGYEVSARLAGGWIPAIQARGFRSSPLFGLFGGAVAAGRLLRLSAEQMTNVIALCVELASGNLEGARVGKRSLEIQEPSAARNAVLAAQLAQAGVAGPETCLEGPAGFYRAFAGGIDDPAPRFHDADRPRPTDITAGLGERWNLMDVALRVFAISGYNLAVVDLVAALARKHALTPSNVDRIRIEMNWLEASYPSPEFADVGGARANPASPHYCAAITLLNGNYPLESLRGTIALTEESAQVLRWLMQRIEVIASYNRPILSPRVTIKTDDGRTLERTATGKEFTFGFAETCKRLEPLTRSGCLDKEQMQGITDAVAMLPAATTIDGLITATTAAPPKRPAG
jgi:2-methylcitrate dehydratase PrpD